MAVQLRNFESVPGYFSQDTAGISRTIFPAIPPRFGLLDSSSERWKNFDLAIDQLNQDAPPGTSYRVFFFSRHGQGYHNVAETKYGTEAWDNHWSKLNGDGEITWGPDPLLTSLGERQALEAKQAWAAEILFDIPLPDAAYCSPLSRALKTCEIMFDGILDYGPGTNHRVNILENCREENGIHTCDKRNSRSYISASFPRFTIENEMTEQDALWDPDIRETMPHMAHRARQVLNHIFEQDLGAKYVSVTAHGGIINGFLVSIGRQPYSLPTGGILPVVIKSSLSR